MNNHNNQQHYQQHHHNNRHQQQNQAHNGIAANNTNYNHSTVGVTTNGHHHQYGYGQPRNGMVSHGKVTIPEMCIFCFDVLYSELHNLKAPKNPSFTNDA